MAWHHTHLPTLHAIVSWYKRRDTFEKTGINLVAWGGAVYIIFTLFFAAPTGFPTGAYINVDEGMSLRQVATLFEEHNVIENAALFEWTVRLLGDDKRVPAGYYFFSRRENMVWVAMRLLGGDFNTNPIRVTVVEGSTVNDIAKLLLQKLPDFNRREFVARAREGYMFPDTYFFRPGQSTETILSVFDNTFHAKMLGIQKQVIDSHHTLDELLTMASLLEKEASKTKDRQMIAGILWRRVTIGMPLQVDAVFPYIIGKNTFQLTDADLKFDSLYNTYINKGLPPGPIDNPGLDSILAAATPTKSNYLYFLSDKNGVFHYATTYAQHLANKTKYLGT
jgi:UPF0755 protein